MKINYIKSIRKDIIMAVFEDTKNNYYENI